MNAGGDRHKQNCGVGKNPLGPANILPTVASILSRLVFVGEGIGKRYKESGADRGNVGQPPDENLGVSGRSSSRRSALLVQRSMK